MLSTGGRRGTGVQERLFPAQISLPRLFELNFLGKPTSPEDLGVCVCTRGGRVPTWAGGCPLGSECRSPHPCGSRRAGQAGQRRRGRLPGTPPPGPPAPRAPQPQARPRQRAGAAGGLLSPAAGRGARGRGRGRGALQPGSGAQTRPRWLGAGPRAATQPLTVGPPPAPPQAARR